MEAELLQNVKQICEMTLGRGDFLSNNITPAESARLDVPTLVLCLKRLIKSVKKWTKHGGRRGYLDYIAQFIA